MKRRVFTTTLALAAVLLSGPAWAQQEAQPAALKGDDLSFVQKARNWLDQSKLVERLNGDVDGWYPKLGGMTTGSGMSLGPGYRAHLAGENGVFIDLSTAISTKSYKTVDARVRWFQAANDRLELWTDYRYQDFSQEDFFGFGNDTTLALRTDYALNSHDITARGIVNAAPWLRLGMDLGYFIPTIGPGEDRNYRSTDIVFSDREAPGLVQQPSFLHSTAFAEIDYRDAKGNPRSGGYYYAGFGVWDDRTLNQYDHKRFQSEVSHFIPVATKKHVIANRVGLIFVNNPPGERVPFYLYPYVGGHNTVRGFKEFRFQDENALWINTEYRYAAGKYTDLALFVDAGKVARNWQDLGFGGMHTAYGFGVRFGTPKRTFARLDFGFGGGEGHQIYFKMGPSF